MNQPQNEASDAEPVIDSDDMRNWAVQIRIEVTLPPALAPDAKRKVAIRTFLHQDEILLGREGMVDTPLLRELLECSRLIDRSTQRIITDKIGEPGNGGRTPTRPNSAGIRRTPEMDER